MRVNLYLCGVGLLGALFLSYCISNLLFLFGGCLHPWIFPAAFCLSAAGITAYSKRQEWLPDILMMLIVTVLALTVSCQFDDYTWDGNTYHQEEIACMMNGWNPFHTEGRPERMELWSIHYAKAIETVAATIALTFNSIESGKAFNVMLICAAGFIIYPFMKQRLGSRRGLILTLAAVANPIGMDQIVTYMIDYAMYYYLAIAIVAAVILTERRRMLEPVIIFMLAVLAIGTKFTSFFFFGIFGLAALAWTYFNGQRQACRTLVLTGVVSLAVGLTLAYHPYITNYLEQGHPFYPLMGEGKVDIMTHNTPSLYHYGRFINFLISISLPKIPGLNFGLDGVGEHGGFGILMPVILISSVAAFAIWYRRFSRLERYIVIVSLLSCFIFEQSWWARYVPQFWICPVTVAFVLLGKNAVKREKMIGYLIAGCCIFNGASFLALTSFRSMRLTLYRNAIYSINQGQTLKVSYETYMLPEATVLHLQEHGVKAEVCSIKEMDLTNSVYFLGFAGENLFSVVELKEGQPELLVETGRRYGFDYSGHRYLSASPSIK